MQPIDMSSFVSNVTTTNEPQQCLSTSTNDNHVIPTPTNIQTSSFVFTLTNCHTKFEEIST